MIGKDHGRLCQAFGVLPKGAVATGGTAAVQHQREGAQCGKARRLGESLRAQRIAECDLRDMGDLRTAIDEVDHRIGFSRIVAGRFEEQSMELCPAIGGRDGHRVGPGPAGRQCPRLGGLERGDGLAAAGPQNRPRQPVGAANGLHEVIAARREAGDAAQIGAGHADREKGKFVRTPNHMFAGVGPDHPRAAAIQPGGAGLAHIGVFAGRDAAGAEKHLPPFGIDGEHLANLPIALGDRIFQGTGDGIVEIKVAAAAAFRIPDQLVGLRQGKDQGRRIDVHAQIDRALRAFRENDPRISACDVEGDDMDGLFATLDIDEIGRLAVLAPPGQRGGERCVVHAHRGQGGIAARDLAARRNIERDHPEFGDSGVRRQAGLVRAHLGARAALRDEIHQRQIRHVAVIDLQCEEISRIGRPRAFRRCRGHGARCTACRRRGRIGVVRRSVPGERMFPSGRKIAQP